MAARLFPSALLVALAIAAGTGRGHSEDVEVPPGIAYKTVDAKTDAAARQAVANAFAGGGEKIFALFDASVMCGPGYWGTIKDDPAIQAATTIPTNFHVPNTTTGEVLELKGAMFKEDAAQKTLADRLAADAGQHPVIRKLRPDELKVYWAMISFDIQEPVYILEAGDKRYLLNLTVEKKGFSIMWVDEISGFSLRAPKSFDVIRIVLYQPDEILSRRLASAAPLTAYIKQLEAVAGNFFSGAKTPETLHIVVAVRPGKLSRVWFVSSVRAGDAKELAPLRKKLEAVVPLDVHEGPVAFAISTKIAGGDGKDPGDDTRFKPPIPKEWTDAVRHRKTSVLVPDGYLDEAWPAPKTKAVGPPASLAP